MSRELKGRVKYNPKIRYNVITDHLTVRLRERAREMAADRDRDSTRRRSRTDFTLEDSVLEINEKRDLVPRRSGWQSEPSPKHPKQDLRWDLRRGGGATFAPSKRPISLSIAPREYRESDRLSHTGPD